MSVDLADYVPSLRREVTPPGSEVFTDVGDDVFTGYLIDAFWEARLDGFLGKWESDEDGIVDPVDPADPDLPRSLVALLLLYAGIKVLRNQILNTQTLFRAKAGPVEYETQNSAVMLAELLKQLKASKDRILDQVASDQYATTVEVLDGYAMHLDQSGWHGLLDHQLDLLLLSGR